jgi:hypothetical protein
MRRRIASLLTGSRVRRPLCGEFHSDPRQTVFPGIERVLQPPSFVESESKGSSKSRVRTSVIPSLESIEFFKKENEFIPKLYAVCELKPWD